MARLKRELKREQLRDELLGSARARLAAMDAEMIVITKKGEKFEVPVGPGGQRDLSQAVKNLIEVFRLEVGESTSRNKMGVDELASFMLGARAAFDVVDRKTEADKQQPV